MPDSHGSWHPESDRVRPERDVGRVEKNLHGYFSHNTVLDLDIVLFIVVYGFN